MQFGVQIVAKQAAAASSRLTCVPSLLDTSASAATEDSRRERFSWSARFSNLVSHHAIVRKITFASHNSDLLSVTGSYFPIDLEMQTLAMLISFPSGRNTPRKRTREPQFFPKSPLNRRLVRQGSEGLGRVVGQRQGVCRAGLGGLTLHLDDGAVCAGLLLLLGVLLDALEEVVARAGGADVLDLDVDALLDVAAPDLLVDDDADRGLGDVVDNAGLTVVDLEGETIPYCQFACPPRVLFGGCCPYPFCTAPLTLMSTMSPTRYWRK